MPHGVSRFSFKTYKKEKSTVVYIIVNIAVCHSGNDLP